MKIAIKIGKDQESMCRNPQKKEVRMTQALPTFGGEKQEWAATPRQREQSSTEEEK
jgi:hypothetical protein